MMWLVSRRPAPPAVGGGDGPTDARTRRLVVRVHEHRYLPGDQSAGGDDGLELSRTLSVRHGAAHGDDQRARPLDHRQRNRTYGIGIDPGDRHRKDLFSAQCGSRAPRWRRSVQCPNSILHQLPRGTQPPQIIYYNASNVPVAQLNVYSDVLSGQQLYDYGFNFHPARSYSPFRDFPARSHWAASRAM